jgi:hypothetical protein
LRLFSPQNGERREQRPTRREREQDRAGNQVFLRARDRADEDERRCGNEPRSQAADGDSTDVMCGHDDSPSLQSH